MAFSDQFLEHIRFIEGRQNLDPAAAAQQEVDISEHDLAEQQYEAHLLGLGDEFFHPEFFMRGTMPRTGDATSDLVNGFGFVPLYHLIREGGTQADPVPGGCICGKWNFNAYGCGHTFREYNVICGMTKAAGGSVTATACASTKGIIHTARRRILGPCGIQGCNWWMERTAAMDELATRLLEDYHMDRVWSE